MEIKIIRSRRRRKTVSARVVKDTLLISAPALIPEVRLQGIIEKLKNRIENKQLRQELNERQDLADVAARFNEKYFGNALKVSSISYVTDQNSRFGCCNYRTGYIRISHRVAAMPLWVRDYVIVHEMAHLIEPNHSPAFWEIVSRYKLAERARGYLIACGMANEK